MQVPPVRGCSGGSLPRSAVVRWPGRFFLRFRMSTENGEIIEGISDSSSARPSQLSGLCVVAVPLGMVISYVMYMTISIGILNNHVHDYLCIFVMDMTGTVRYTIIEKEGVFVANKEQDRRNIWQKENQERIIVMTSKSESPTKDQIRDAAKNAGQSMNAYILDAVRERMDRERSDD